MSADNQQERPTDEVGILRDYTLDSDRIVGEDIVRTAWRHAEINRNIYPFKWQSKKAFGRNII